MKNIWVDIMTDMFRSGQITAAKGMKKAVKDGLIGPDEYKQITGEEYTAPAAGGNT